MEKEDRLKSLKTMTKPKETLSKNEPKILACVTISCGLWDYIGENTVFKPYFTLNESANMKFLSRSVFIKTDTSRRLDIFYNSIEFVTWEGLPTQSITFTLREAPRFFNHVNLKWSNDPDDSISSMNEVLVSLAIFDYNSSDWNRVPGLGEDHQEISGNCLVYRFLLGRSNELNSQLKALSRIRGMPSITRRHIHINQLTEPYIIDFKRLL